MESNNKKSILGARPWIYLYAGPFFGYISMIFYSIVHSTLVGSFGYSDLGELLLGFLVFIFLAYVIGVLPALITGIIINLFSKFLCNYFEGITTKLIVPAAVGFLTTISLLILFMYYTNEMDELVKVHPTSIIAISIYAAIASAVCESIYLKLGSPSSLE